MELHTQVECPHCGVSRRFTTRIDSGEKLIECGDCHAWYVIFFEAVLTARVAPVVEPPGKEA